MAAPDIPIGIDLGKGFGRRSIEPLGAKPCCVPIVESLNLGCYWLFRLVTVWGLLATYWCSGCAGCSGWVRFTV